MIFTQYDYHPPASGPSDPLAAWWSSHWEGRAGLRDDCTREPAWTAVGDILDRRPGRVLEAGCGVPNWVHALGRRGHMAVGLDYASSCLRIGKSAEENLRLVQGDIRSLPFADDSFDYVISLGAVEHDVNGPEAALRELRRVVSPSGYLMCSVPCLNAQRHILLPWMVGRDWLKRQAWVRRVLGKRDPFAFYQYVYAPRTYRGILESCGLKVLGMRPYGTTGRSPLACRLNGVLNRVSPFWSCHMVMAICRKAAVPARDGPAPGEAEAAAIASSQNA